MPTPFHIILEEIPGSSGHVLVNVRWEDEVAFGRELSPDLLADLAGRLPRGQAGREHGARIFAALFGAPATGKAYADAEKFAVSTSDKLSIEISACSAAAAVPWEAALDPRLAPEPGDHTLGSRHHVTRVLVGAPVIAPQALDGPLRVLGVVATPSRLPALNADHEISLIESALAQAGADGTRVEVTWLRHATIATLRARMIQDTWQALHYIGHGEFGGGTTSSLILEDQHGSQEPISAGSFADLLSEAPARVRLVVLNTCHGGSAHPTSQYAGLASALARRGVAAVVGMQGPVPDNAAIAFAGGFYTALASGASPDASVYSGRHALATAAPDKAGLPVLYRPEDQGALFTVMSSSTDGPPRVSPISDLHSAPRKFREVSTLLIPHTRTSGSTLLVKGSLDVITEHATRPIAVPSGLPPTLEDRVDFVELLDTSGMERRGWDESDPWDDAEARQRARHYWRIGRDRVVTWLTSGAPRDLLLAVRGPDGRTVVRYAWEIDPTGRWEAGAQCEWFGIPLGKALDDHPALHTVLLEDRDGRQVQVLKNYVAGWRELPYLGDLRTTGSALTSLTVSLNDAESLVSLADLRGRLRDVGLEVEAPTAVEAAAPLRGPAMMSASVVVPLLASIPGSIIANIITDWWGARQRPITIIFERSGDVERLEIRSAGDLVGVDKIIKHLGGQHRSAA